MCDCGICENSSNKKNLENFPEISTIVVKIRKGIQLVKSTLDVNFRKIVADKNKNNKDTHETIVNLFTDIRHRRDKSDDVLVDVHLKCA
jgi:hypothetical protein